MIPKQLGIEITLKIWYRICQVLFFLVLKNEDIYNAFAPEENIMREVQLDMLKSVDECEMDAVKDTLDKVRKSTYARMNGITAEVVELKIKLAILERYICKQGKLS
jgi:hypothetical protein